MRKRQSWVDSDLTTPISEEGKENIIRRQSKRIRRASLSLSDYESYSVDRILKPRPKRIRRSSIGLSIEKESDSNAACDSQSEPANQTSINTLSLSRLSVSSPNKFDNTTIQIQSPSEPTIPNWLAEIYLPKQYHPPVNKGLPTLLEESSPSKRQRKPLRSRNPSAHVLRRQFFTGQTIEEACAPSAPGYAPLDPEIILSVTRQRILYRQRRAKKLGFRGINISEETEGNFARLIHVCEDLDPDSGSETV